MGPHKSTGTFNSFPRVSKTCHLYQSFHVERIHHLLFLPLNFSAILIRSLSLCIVSIFDISSSVDKLANVPLICFLLNLYTLLYLVLRIYFFLLGRIHYVLLMFFSSFHALQVHPVTSSFCIIFMRWFFMSTLQKTAAWNISAASILMAPNSKPGVSDELRAKIFDTAKWNGFSILQENVEKEP